ncbi:MAG TPA: carboxypeptidase-like regulatory domain-containing protein [Terriglobales bacterium]|nr:carboxypeptidase-like regulatory domain-containing protein [Terriglobales bacterium]
MKSIIIVLAFWTLSCTSFALGQRSPANNSSSPPNAPGSISGTIVDQSGAVVAGAKVKLTYVDPQPNSQGLTAVADNDGEFFFPKVDPGAFQLAITSSGFEAKTYSGSLHPGEIETLPQIAIDVAEARTEVQVGLSQVEVATEEIKEEEHQRVLGVVPNFYVSYVPNAAPLDAKQKFQLAFRTIIDPFTFFVVGATAAIEQGQNHFAAYGQGAQGYGKRFGATYADTVTGTLIGGAILPALLRQDPRYFYKGTGSVASRGTYAIASAFICKGDNGKWQPNYSNVLGSLAAGGMSNLYYPDQDRNGAGLTMENAAIGLGATAIQNLFQEFIVKKLTPRRKGQKAGP